MRPIWLGNAAIKAIEFEGNVCVSIDSIWTGGSLIFDPQSKNYAAVVKHFLGLYPLDELPSQEELKRIILEKFGVYV